MPEASRQGIAAAPGPLTFGAREQSPLSIRAKALVFVDPRTQALRERCETLAEQPLALLIQGENGTGKELLARHAHRCSGRQGLFVSLNVASLSARHGEAELFGYAARAHPGSPSSRAGWFGSATGGTLYLDEIAELPRALQRRLLQALQTGEVLRVGASQATPADVRLIAASSLDLERACAAGRFDGQLLDYLRDGWLELPPLRARPGDILPLAEYFLASRSTADTPPAQLTDAACQRLLMHPWPGNIRELESCLAAASLLADHGHIDAAHLALPEDDLVQRLTSAWSDAQQRQALRPLLQRLLAQAP